MSRKPRPSVKPDFGESDLEELIAAHIAANTPQPGERSTVQIAERYHLTLDRARDMLEQEETAGRVSRRKCGRFTYWKRIK